jgi:hypothetical protein
MGETGVCGWMKALWVGLVVPVGPQAEDGEAGENEPDNRCEFGVDMGGDGGEYCPDGEEAVRSAVRWGMMPK